MSGGYEAYSAGKQRDRPVSAWLSKAIVKMLAPLVAASLLIGCDDPLPKNEQADFTAMGAASPMREDATPIPLMLGGDYYEIPANYIDAPLSPRSHTGGVPVVDDILLAGTAPDFLGRSPANRGRFREGGHGPYVYVYLHAPPIGVDQALRNTRAHLLKGVRITSTEHLKEEDHLQVTGDSSTFVDNGSADIFVSRLTNDSALCNVVGNGQSSAECTMYVKISNAMADIRIGRSRMSERQEILSVVKSQLDSWRKPFPGGT